MRTNTGQLLYIPKVGQRADFQHPLMRGCVGWWPLTDGAGGIAKDIAGTNDGTQSGGVTWADTKKGRVASFDGVDDRFLLRNGLSRNQTAMTISAWVKPDVVSTNTMVYYESNNTGVNFTRVNLVVNAGSVQTGGRDDDSDGFTTFAQSNLGVVATNIWQHLVAVVDPTGGGCKVYLDGVDVTNTSNNTGNGFPDTDPLYYAIGSHSSNGYTFDGKIQNLRVWDRALSSSEVFELYINPWSGLSIPSSTRYFYFPTTLPLSETLGTFKMRNLSFTPKSGGRTIIRKPS